MIGGSKRKQIPHCSICRKQWPGKGHRCRQSVLDAIDSADSAAWNRELRSDSRPEHPLTIPGLHKRLADGFRAIGGDE